MTDAVPGGAPDGRPLLDVRQLRMHFPIQKGVTRRVVGWVRAVDDVNFEIREGETLGLVGESGCGKTTAARCILRAYAPTGGEILFRTAAGPVVDLARLSRQDLRPIRPQIQMIFQDPYASLNPRMTIADIVGEPLLVNGLADRRVRTERVADLLQLVGLRPEFMQRFPHAFSSSHEKALSSESMGTRCRAGANSSDGRAPTRWVGLSGVMNSGNSSSRLRSSRVSSSYSASETSGSSRTWYR